MKHFVGEANPMRSRYGASAGFEARHFSWACSDGVGTVTLSRPERKNPLTRMTGDLVKTMRNCPQPVIGAIDGICAGAGAMMALACDIRHGTPATRTAFLFTRVGLAGADMGACALLPRVIDMALQMHGGQGVRVGSTIEHLYRDIRSLRIYEGATEVQQLIIGKAVLTGAAS